MVFFLEGDHSYFFASPKKKHIFVCKSFIGISLETWPLKNISPTHQDKDVQRLVQQLLKKIAAAVAASVNMKGLRQKKWKDGQLKNLELEELHGRKQIPTEI